MSTPEKVAENAAISFVLALGNALHRYGTPAHRLEEALKECCRRLELDAEVFTTPTTIIMSFGEPHELRTRMMRVDSTELDMDKLARVDALADRVAAQAVSPADGVVQLEEILAARRRYRARVSTPMHAVTAGALAVFFGGGLPEVAVAAVIGLALGTFAIFAQRSTDQARVFELAGAAFASLTANVVSAYVDYSPSLATVAALIVLLPGMSLTIAMTELATRNLIAGTARLMSAVIVLLELVVGVALGERAAATLVDIHQIAPVALPAWSQWAALGASLIGVAVLVQTQPRAFVWILLTGVLGYIAARIGTGWLGQLGAMFGAFAVGIVGNVYARYLQRPAQIVTVPAVLLLVPGAMGFRGIRSLLTGETLTGVGTVFEMFIVATAIVAGLLIANAALQPRRSL
ncbi:MAG: threonine/serine exporter family protein [Deltaproteobacteria bacterium]|nr:threonine/serine exporter family protein [Deltaproteobacteria bacterium]MCW5808199.1 threonine/serine exporter family protein [Deltaproteobacteria bacterium]